MIVRDTKKANLIRTNALKYELRRVHPLQHLFIEMTQLCNEHCRHCGSRCGDSMPKDSLSKDEIVTFLSDLSKKIDPASFQLCITGGEPLLRPDFFEIMEQANALGFHWGMTSNGTLIDKECAHRLYQAGMKTISISLDGLRDTNDWFRQKAGGFDAALNGAKNLIEHGGFNHVQITTVVTKKNIDELEELYHLLLANGIRSWRVVNIDPIGRAKEQPDLILDSDDYVRMFQFIKEKRSIGQMRVDYGCSHYLGVEYEGEVRPWYFICKAGLTVASIMYNGDIGACLDIERRPELIQGNIRRDDFLDVWNNRFEIFRKDSRKCKGCKHYKYCGGDSFHTWNFDENRPDICFSRILF